MRYRYRHFIEREFVATRKWLGLSLVRWSDWWRSELEHLERYLSQRGEWYAVALTGFLGVILTLMLLASYREPTLYNVNIELPPMAARLPRVPELPVADVDTRISLAPTMVVADYPAEFMFVGLERRVVDPYVSRSTFTVPADLSLSVDWLHSVVPEAALAAMDASRNEATASSDSSQSSRAWSDVLNRIRDDWRRAQPRSTGSQMARYSLNTPYTGLGNRLPKSLKDDLTSDVPKSTVPARGEAYFEVTMESSRRDDLQQGGESIVTVRNLSSETLPLVEVIEPFSRMPHVVGAFPDGYVDQEGLKRSISLLPPGESERLTTRWLSSQQTANDLLSTNIGRFPAGATSREYRLPTGNSSRVETVAEVTADAVAGSRTLVTPPRKNARLAIQLSSTDRIIKGKNLKMNIRVQNIGEIPLDNVRILADLSPELTHYYGNAVEYEVGSLRLNEDHQTIFIIEGKIPGAGKAVLRAVSPDTPIAMEVSQLLVTDETGYVPAGNPVRETPRERISDTPVPRPDRLENRLNDSQNPTFRGNDSLSPRDRRPALPAQPQTPVIDDGLFGPAPGDLPANPRASSPSNLDGLRNPDLTRPRVPAGNLDLPGSNRPFSSPMVDDPVNRSSRTGRDFNPVRDPIRESDFNSRDRSIDPLSTDPVRVTPPPLDSIDRTRPQRPSLPAVNEPALELRTPPARSKDDPFGPAPAELPPFERETSPSMKDGFPGNTGDFPPLPNPDNRQQPSRDLPARIPSELTPFDSSLPGDPRPSPTNRPPSDLPSRGLPLEDDRLDHLPGNLMPARPGNPPVRPVVDPLDEAFPSPLRGGQPPVPTPSDSRDPFSPLPELTPRSRETPVRQPSPSIINPVPIEDRIDKTIPNRSGWNPTLPRDSKPVDSNDPLAPFPELNNPLPPRNDRSIPRQPDSLDAATPEADAPKLPVPTRSGIPQPALEPDPFSNGSDPLDLLEKADPASTNSSRPLLPESGGGRRTLPALPTELPDDFPPLSPKLPAGQSSGSTRTRELPSSLPEPATRTPAEERRQTTPKDPFDPFPADDGVIRNGRPGVPEKPAQPVAGTQPRAPAKIISASYKETVPAKAVKTPSPL